MTGITKGSSCGWLLNCLNILLYPSNLSPHLYPRCNRHNIAYRQTVRFYSYLIRISMSNREVITLQVGGCGNRVGAAFWEQLHKEHIVTADGVHQNPQSDQNIHAFYSEGKDGVHRPRSLLIDFDCRPIQSALSSPYSRLLKLQNCIYSSVSSIGLWANSFDSAESKALKREAMEAIRREIEGCDNLPSFQLIYSSGGGTGSGIGSYLISEINSNYKQAVIFPFVIIPSPKFSTNTFQLYNAIWQMGNNSFKTTPYNKFIFQNDYIEDKKIAEKVAYADINRRIVECLCDISSTHRYSGGELNYSYRKIQNNLSIYPHLQLVTATRVLINNQKNKYDRYTPFSMALQATSGPSLSEVKNRNGDILSAVALFKGDWTIYECETSVFEVLHRRSYMSHGVIPHCMNVTLLGGRSKSKDSQISKSVLMLQSNTAQVYMVEKIYNNYWSMMRRKSYHHLFSEERLSGQQNAQKNIERYIGKYQRMNRWE